MSRDEIVSMVNRILVDEFEKEENEIKPESSLFDDLELDSLDGIDLIVALEKAVKQATSKDVKIDEDKAKSLKTVNDIYKVIEELAK